MLDSTSRSSASAVAPGPPTSSAADAENWRWKSASRPSRCRDAGSSRSTPQSIVERIVCWRRGASRGPSAQNREAGVEQAEQLRAGDRPEPGRGELDREWQAVQAPAQLGEHAVVQVDGGARGLGATGEELPRGPDVERRARRRHARRRVGAAVGSSRARSARARRRRATSGLRRPRPDARSCRARAASRARASSRRAPATRRPRHPRVDRGRARPSAAAGRGRGPARGRRAPRRRRARRASVLASSTARRVLPMPPGPTSVTRRVRVVE